VHCPADMDMCIFSIREFKIHDRIINTMRLLNTESLELSRLYVPSEVPDYAILSHRWNTEEVTFADMSNASGLQSQSQLQNKNGFAKILGACKQALQDGYAWIWIDSCCIDKSSSAELQEAINSMWRYYAESNICYAYLADVPDAEAGWDLAFAKSEWFTRGWTLQELIAPTCVEFFAENWVAVGTKFQLYSQIAEITGIDPDILIRKSSLDDLSAAERLSWAAHRNVTRGEDEAYSLMGMFDVNMPLLYGEGREKAFVRLQEAIYNATADHSMFLFRHSQHKDAHPLLASSPTSFCDKIYCPSCLSQGRQNAPPYFWYRDIISSERWTTQAHEQIMTNVTMSRNEMSTVLPLLAYRDVSRVLKFFGTDISRAHVTHVAVLNHTTKEYPQGAFCILLRRERGPDVDAYARLYVVPAILPYVEDLKSLLVKTKLLVCPGPRTLEGESLAEVVFLLDSDAFCVDEWSATGVSSLSFASPSQHPAFKIQFKKLDSTKVPIQVSCRIFDSQNPHLWFSIQLIQMHDTWSIKDVYAAKTKGKGTPKIHKLFASDIIVDRCGFFLLDQRKMSVKFRRLPGCARTPGDNVTRSRYQISVDCQ
jgi:hypothetical protein